MPTKILAIDDSKTMRLAIKITFAAEDADVTSVGKGSEAVARAKQMGADVVLVDAALGDAEPSGYDVCQQLKSDPATASIPVIIMVSNQQGVDQAKVKAAGGDAWIAKPFDSQDLIEKVSEATGKPVAKPTATAAAPRPAAAAPPTPTLSTPSRPAAPKPAPVRPVAKPAPAPITPKPAPRPVAATPRVAATPAAAPAPGGGKIPIAIPIPFTAADAPTPGILKRLAGSSAASGLDPKVAEALLSLSREVVEAVVWEVVPDLAEELIKKQAQSA